MIYALLISFKYFCVDRIHADATSCHISASLSCRRPCKNHLMDTTMQQFESNLPFTLNTGNVPSGHRDEGVEDPLVEFVLTNARDNQPDSVLECFYTFCCANGWTKHMSYQKGFLLTKSLEQLSFKPWRAALQIGMHYGWSAVQITGRMPNPDCMLYCIEPQKNRLEVSSKILQKAGVLDRWAAAAGWSYTSLYPTCLGW